MAATRFPIVRATAHQANHNIWYFQFQNPQLNTICSYGKKSCKKRDTRLSIYSDYTLHKIFCQ